MPLLTLRSSETVSLASTRGQTHTQTAKAQTQSLHSLVVIVTARQPWAA